MKSLTICYLLETTELHGGVRVVFDQARALKARGHQVMIRACLGDHGWYPYPVDVQYVSDLGQPFAGPKPDVVIATFWTTVTKAMAMGAPLTVHLCQGCEWEMPEYEFLRADIERAYAQEIPKVTIGPWLNARIQERFGRDNFPLESVGQVVDLNLYHPPLSPRLTTRMIPGKPWQILLVGIYEAWVKGIAVALEAVEMLRAEGFDLRVTRVSTMPLSAAERERFNIDSYHHGVTPVRMAELYRQADIFLAPSRSAEGFGLPFVEALATGLPVVATSIPSYLSIDKRADYACFVPEGNAVAMAVGLRELLTNENLRLRLSLQALEAVRNRFGAEAVAGRLETCFQRWLSRG